MPKTIEIRRHSIRRPPAPHLIQAGVDLARRVGETAGPFELVVTSPAPRAFETAIAMGFAVHRQEELISGLPDAVAEVLPFPQPFEAYSEARHHPAVLRHMKKLSQYFSGLALSLREGGAALVVCHGGIVEISSVACVPEADYEAFGPQLECCEGVRLTWDHDHFLKAKVIRLAPDLLAL